MSAALEQSRCTVLSVAGAQRLRGGLSLLTEARAYAQDLDRPPWDFAVEIASLEAAGLTASDLRWLLCKGYVEHAVEMAGAQQGHRAYHLHGGLRFTASSCFRLTEAGIGFARTLGEQAEGLLAKPAQRPCWDQRLHELYYGPILVKCFRRPAQNQERILTVFEEEEWPVQIDDPLPGCNELLAKERLRETIKGLNHHQRQRLLLFHGDGTGCAIRWSLANDATLTSPPERPRIAP